MSSAIHKEWEAMQECLQENGLRSPLPPHRQRELARKAASGDGGARNELVETNLSLVISIAYKHRGRGVDFEDLVSEGAIGMMRAIEKFDPDRGVRFSTYATWWVRQAIGRAISQKGTHIRLPVYLHNRLSRISKARERLRQSLGRDPQDREIAEALGFSQEAVANAKRASSSAAPDSLDRPLGEEGDGPLVGEIFASCRPSPDYLLDEAEEWADLSRALSRLPEDRRRLLQKRYGLGGDDAGDSMTLAELAGELGCSRQKAQILWQKALEELRAEMFPGGEEGDG